MTDQTRNISLGFQDDVNTGNAPSLVIATYNGSSHGVIYNYGSTITTGNWYHIVGTFDGSTYRLFVNGSQVASSSDSTSPHHSAKVPLLAALDINGSLYYFNGTLDEARISSSARSADWITTEYNNQTSPSTFYNEGSAVISTLSPTTGTFGTSVTITGRNFGSTQGTSTVTLRGATTPVTSWSNTSIVVTVPAGASSGNVVVTVSGVASNGVNFTVFPTGWSDQDVGSVAIAGNASYSGSSGVFTVQGGGNWASGIG